jgi:phosphatidylglycerol:prolipoprotein diacylglycerol transferase
MPFIHNINPVLLSLGPVEVRYYGLAYAIGFIYLYYVLRKAAESGSIKNFGRVAAEELALYAMLGVIAGGRLGYFIFNMPLELLKNPLELFMIWHGGMSFHGGFMGAVAAGWIFARKRSISFWQLADLAVVPAAFAIALGRIANFINSELVGRQTDVSWCVYFHEFEGCRHPYQLYQSLALFAVFGILLALRHRMRQKHGALFWAFVLLYGVARFITDFWRDDALMLLGLSGGQVLSLLMAAAALAAIVQFWRRNLK